jgi:dephospho-CoA kinase
MIKVGITGGIGSGKTIVCEIFAKLGVPVFYADIEAKALLDVTGVKEQIIALCGKQILTPENNIDRKKMAAAIFNNQTLLGKVNQLIHPLVRDNFQIWAEKQKSNFVIKEAALIFETSANKLLDYTVMVNTPLELRIKRVMERDQVSREQVLSRIKNQMPDEEKIKLADFIIENNEKQLVIPQVIKLYDFLIQKEVQKIN